MTLTEEDWIFVALLVLMTIWAVFLTIGLALRCFTLHKYKCLLTDLSFAVSYPN